MGIVVLWWCAVKSAQFSKADISYLHGKIGLQFIKAVNY